MKMIPEDEFLEFLDRYTTSKYLKEALPTFLSKNAVEFDLYHKRYDDGLQKTVLLYRKTGAKNESD